MSEMVREADRRVGHRVPLLANRRGDAGAQPGSRGSGASSSSEDAPRQAAAR